MSDFFSKFTLTTWENPLLTFGALALLTLALYIWIKGAQRRRFKKAYRMPDKGWTEADTAFLSLAEHAYRLPRGWGQRIPRGASPMRIYLTLYPTHCIYDTGENEAFLRGLPPALRKSAADENLLNRSFADLAAAFTAANPT